MTYPDFLRTLISPIHTFFDSFSSLLSVLLQNYIFITVFGLILFISFFITIKNIIFDFFDKKTDFDNIVDKGGKK